MAADHGHYLILLTWRYAYHCTGRELLDIQGLRGLSTSRLEMEESNVT